MLLNQYLVLQKNNSIMSLHILLRKNQVSVMTSIRHRQEIMYPEIYMFKYFKEIFWHHEAIISYYEV